MAQIKTGSQNKPKIKEWKIVGYEGNEKEAKEIVSRIRARSKDGAKTQLNSKYAELVRDGWTYEAIEIISDFDASEAEKVASQKETTQTVASPILCDDDFPCRCAFPDYKGSVCPVCGGQYN